MSGETLPVIPKRSIDFGTLAVGVSQEVILADRLPLLHWRELTIKVRVHNHSLTGGGSNTIQINVTPQSWTEEDPGIPFLSNSPFSAATIGSATSNPTVLSAGPIPSIAAMARVTVVGTRAQAGAMNASLSIEFSTKDA